MVVSAKVAHTSDLAPRGRRAGRREPLDFGSQRVQLGARKRRIFRGSSRDVRRRRRSLLHALNAQRSLRRLKADRRDLGPDLRHIRLHMLCKRGKARADRVAERGANPIGLIVRERWRPGRGRRRGRRRCTLRVRRRARNFRRERVVALLPLRGRRRWQQHGRSRPPRVGGTVAHRRLGCARPCRRRGIGTSEAPRSLSCSLFRLSCFLAPA